MDTGEPVPGMIVVVERVNDWDAGLGCMGRHRPPDWSLGRDYGITDANGEFRVPGFTACTFVYRFFLGSGRSVNPPHITRYFGATHTAVKGGAVETRLEDPRRPLDLKATTDPGRSLYHDYVTPRAFSGEDTLKVPVARSGWTAGPLSSFLCGTSKVEVRREDYPRLLPVLQAWYRGCCWSWDGTPCPASVSDKRLYELWSSRFTGMDRHDLNFVIRGRVVDHNGSLLKDVLVLSRSLKSEELHTVKCEDRTIVNSPFELKFRQTEKVFLSFVAAGHHSRSLEFDSLNLGREAHTRGGKHTYENVVVVLKKLAHSPWLHEYEPVLSCGADGRLRAWDVSGVGGRRIAAICTDLPSTPASDLPCVYVRVGRGRTPVAPAMQGDEQVSPRDGVVQLVLQDGRGGGFVRADSVGKPPEDPVLDMITAPTEGYSPTLDFLPDDMVGFHNGKEVWFYFRLNGLYGKGRVRSLLYLAPSAITRCRLRLYVQPDGSNSVETLSW